MQKIFNIGILAHVDAGKTTITENLLYLSGAIRSMGSVDKGSAITDSLEVEQKRGISVRSAAVSFEWKNSQINLIDTPGHADFSAEVERVLSVLDGAILVVTAVDGVQAHTFSLFDALRDLNIPTLIFVNKIDRAGSDVEEVIKEIKKELKCYPFPVYGASRQGVNDANIFALWGNEDSDKTEAPDWYKNFAIESIAEFDEGILENYLEEKPIHGKDLLAAAKTNINPRRIVPIFTGIAKTGIGIEALMDGITEFFPAAEQDVNAAPSALVFKIEHNKGNGRLAHIRLFGGTLKSKETLFNHTQQKEEKIGLIQKVFTSKLEITGELTAGNIGVITGLSGVNAGDILGNPDNIKPGHILNVPVLTTKVLPVNDKDYANLAEALQFINSEDPTLDFKWYKAEKEMHLRMMGPMQIEILTAILKDRFGIEVQMEDPTVIYKERPSSPSIGSVRYTMPKPCWAVMQFTIEPGPRGSGLVFESKVRTSDIAQKYQNEVERTLPKALEQGIKGWEVTDLKITLTGGEDHEMHSRPGDFVLATPMGVMKGLQKSDTVLLEPILDFEIKAPEENLGNIASELTRMRAQFGNPVFEDGRFTLKGTVPVATSMNYSIQLNSTTGGKGRVLFNFSGYAECPEGEGKTRDYKGVNPLNEPQWILHRRGAFKAEERRL